MKKTLLTLAVLLMVGSAFAQGEGITQEKTTLWQMIKTGGWAMWPLGGFSIFMVTLIVQNFISLRPKKLLHTEQMPELIDMMLKKKCKSALIYCRENPSMFANTFGAGLERTLDGEEDLIIPAGTQTGEILRLKARGVPYLRRAGRGDQLVVITVVTPQKLTEKQRELLQELGDTLGKEIIAQREKGFLDRVKDAFGL